MIYILAILWPFAALVLSIRNFNYRDFCIGVLSVAVMFGLCVQIFATQTFNSDITRVVVVASSYKYVPWANIFMERDYFIGVSGKLLCYISDDKRFIVVSYTIIKTLLFLRCVKIVMDNISLSNKRMGLLPLLAMILVVLFFDVNSLRFAIANMFFVWCSLEILINQKKIFYLLILLCPFIHYAFWIIVPVPLLYLLLKNRTWLVWALFVLSFVFSTASTSVWINDFVGENMNEEIAESVEGYASERGLEVMEERYSGLATSGNMNRAISRAMVDVRNYGVMICTVLFSIYAFRKKKENTTINQLTNYLLIVYSFANIANTNSQGKRFYLMAAILVVFLLVFITYKDDVFYKGFYKTNKHLINFVYCLVAIAGALYLYIGRIMYNFLGVLFGNFFIHL